MTSERQNELLGKFEELFEGCLQHPPLGDCDCPLYEDEGGRLTQECVASCHNWQCEEERQMYAFSSAVCDLFGCETLSTEEVAEFVNLRGKEVLSEFDITCKAHGEGGWLWSWGLKAAVALPLPSQATAQAVGEVQDAAVEDVAPAGRAAYLLWKLLPDHRRQDVLGDMDEEFAAKRESLGEVQARQWLWNYMASLVWSLLEQLVRKALWVLAVAFVHWLTGLLTGNDNR